MILTVPRDESLWPTLGPQVCDFIEQNMVHGPGDLRGKPVTLDVEQQFFIYRFYEVFPQGRPRAGRRRFTRCALSLAKGLRKTELAAFIAACELHPDAPVRCTGWTKGGDPIGGPVTDPYIPMLAYNEVQSSELAYGALKAIIEEGPLRDDFDVGLERIMRKKGDGKAESLSTSPNARDGARTTFAVMDETHRMTLQRLRDAHQTMLANNAKRPLANPWMLEITTAPEPGAGSVAESTMEFAESVDQGRVTEASFFFFHRQANDEHDLSTDDGARAAVIEASGPAAEWRDIEGIVSLLKDPNVDRAYWERVWLNRLVKGATQAFSVEAWKALAAPQDVPAKRKIVLGFDGAMFRDSTALVATGIEDGHQWLAGLWECPTGRDLKKNPWQVPAEDVDLVVRGMFEGFEVWRMYADPPYWQSWIAKWAGEFGKERVIEWWTNRRRQMTAALENFDTAIKEGQLSHDGSKDLQRHIGNARKKELTEVGEDGRRLWLIQKERPDSPHKIDACMAAVLSWEARTDAIAAGVLHAPEPTYQMFIMGAR
jgi:phage terminase large subunit-like protein